MSLSVNPIYNRHPPKIIITHLMFFVTEIIFVLYSILKTKLTTVCRQKL